MYSILKLKSSSSYFENNSAIHSGGLSKLKVSNVTVENSNFTDNSAVHGAGAIGNDGEIRIESMWRLKIQTLIKIMLITMVVL